MTPTVFVDVLSAIRLEAVFNPYSERCVVHDRQDAALRRRNNLLVFLNAALNAKTDSIWIARDLGYRGGRRTGLPLTDEIHIPTITKLFGDLNLSRATVGPAIAERTAAATWQVLSRLDRPVFLWNIFPLHPHEPGEPLSNRCHTRRERAVCENLLFTLLDMLAPSKVVAIGRDAQSALTELDIPFYGVRHPSYGGQRDFVRGISEIYSKRTSRTIADHAS